MPPPDPRTLDERLEDIRILTAQLLRARDVSADVQRISALLRHELEEFEAAEAIVIKPPISGE